MRARVSAVGRGLMAVAGLTAGLALAAVFIATGQEPAYDPAAVEPRRLAFIEAQPLAFRIEARGYGVARPAEAWQATANVAGRVVERHPELESGNLLEEGTQLVALDPSRYQLAIAEAQAELASLSAEQSQLDTEQENTRRLLELERERLELAKRELERIERLFEQDSVSRSQRDEQRRANVAQRQAVASLENELALIPARRERLQAQIDQTRTQLEQARQDLADTRFEAPYDLRLHQVDVEMHQHVSAGQRLFEADSLAAAEVEAHVPLPMLRRLLASVAPQAAPAPAMELRDQVDFSAIDAAVELVGAEGIRWPARVSRLSSGLDPNTRSARVVVTVDEPYGAVLPPDRPPLQRGMYTRVRLAAESPERLLAVPAAAVHQTEVYVVDGDNRLQRRAVEVAFEQRGLAVLRSGVRPGDKVIVDDPVPAISGMPVTPRRDEALEANLRERARSARP